MNTRDWITDNILNYNNIIKTEEDVKIKVILPLLKFLGYEDKDIEYETRISVQVGTKKLTDIRSDIAIKINDEIQLIIDTKSPNTTLSEKEILQCTSYAKLISTPPALYAITTNGADCVVTNIYTGKRSSDIPSKNQLIIDVIKTRKKELSPIQLREVQSVLLTLYSEQELYKIINKCKDIIEKRALIRNDQSFKEMTKILLVKMNEERRVKDNKENRFSIEYIQTWARSEETNELEVFKSLFLEAKSQYPVYSNPDESFKIKDNVSIVEIIKKLESWSFLGTGDDIKGAVYEIFLKSTLRGDFDQYFTPREIVDYMVQYADPCIGDKILDPACGSGGFLIQAFRYVNQKIIDSPFSELEGKKKFKELIDKCLWGHEADEDLHVLAKINLIMHGDGYNNIYQGDTLRSEKLPNDFFDVIFTNPPFTLPYSFSDVLSQYELGLGHESQELDILFVEKCIKVLDAKRGGELYIVLPEGLLNVKKYQSFREWLLSKCYLVTVISLPEGAFIPFGQSVSKTAILGLRKKDSNKPEKNIPYKVFLGNAKQVGYEIGKRDYKPHNQSDLKVFLEKSKMYFDGIYRSEYGGECGWIEQSEITDRRIDASFLLNIQDRNIIKGKFETVIPLKELCVIQTLSKTPLPSEQYYYLEIPDISPQTGAISNIHYVEGSQIKSSMNVFHGGDVIFSRINPRKNRVTVIPQIIKEGLVSKEAYILKLKENDFVNDEYVLCALLQSEHVCKQIVRLATGSSSSRARVYENDLLEYVYIPVPDQKLQEQIAERQKNIYFDYWEAAQKFLAGYSITHKQLFSELDNESICEFNDLSL